MTAEASAEPLKVYWQPGCSSCLKTKEFLSSHGVAFESINVLEDEKGFEELARLGVRLVPIVARGTDWANGAVFRDVARVAGFDYGGHDMLSPRELVSRLDTILAAARRFTAQISEDDLDTMLPDRPRSYRQLSYHIFQIPDVFLDLVEKRRRVTYEALISNVPAGLATRDDLVAYGAGVRGRLSSWWRAAGQDTDFDQPGDVYYGDVSLHEVLERTTWHSGQHTRQLMLVLGKLGVAPDQPLIDTDFQGLPMPEQVWDDEKSFD